MNQVLAEVDITVQFGSNVLMARMYIVMYTPVAVLVSHERFDRLRGKGSHFRETYRNFLEKYSVKGIGLEDDFIVFMRDKSTGRKVSL